MSIASLRKWSAAVGFRCGIWMVLGSFLLMPNGLQAQNAGSASPASASGSQWALVPMPREIEKRASLSLSGEVGVFAAGHEAQDAFAVKDLVKGLKERGVDARASHRGHVRIELLRENTREAKRILRRAHVTFTAAMHGQGYVLLTRGRRCYDIAATGAGLYYGAQTIKQLVRGGHSHDANPVLRGVLIRDWPAMKYRGMDDDLSRGPVPTLAFQEHQVRVLSEYKVNVYSPYFENTLKYPEDPLAAPPGGAMTEADVKALVAYARRYHVTIIPEQEAFGHLNHVLMYDKYSELAETFHGSVLAPGQPGSLKLIRQWFTQISSMFPGPFIHIGADETFSLGRGQTKARVEKEGLDAVYIDFLKQIHQELAPLHKRILFWGDIAMHSPQLVKTLPQDMIAVPWVYNPQPQGYTKWIKPYIDAGMETWVAPGISNWRRVYPDFNAGFSNMQQFIADGQRLGATGELNTVWNDFGEGLFNLDWYGALYGAAAGWEPAPANIAQFQNSYGQVFHGDTTGKINLAQKKLMAAQKVLEGVGLAATTAHTFWVDPFSAEGQEISTKLLPVAHTVRVDAEQAIVLIDEAREAGHLREPHALDAMEMGARRLDFLAYKFEAAHQIAEQYNRAYWEQKDPVRKEHVGRKLGAISGVDGECQNLRDGFGLMRDLYRRAWLEENRPYWLNNVMAKYELAQQRWIRRANRFAEIHRQWYQTHTLPTPQAAGLPTVPVVVPQSASSPAPHASTGKGNP